MGETAQCLQITKTEFLYLVEKLYCHGVTGQMKQVRLFYTVGQKQAGSLLYWVACSLWGSGIGRVKGYRPSTQRSHIRAHVHRSYVPHSSMLLAL